MVEENSNNNFKVFLQTRNTKELVCILLTLNSGFLPFNLGWFNFRFRRRRSKQRRRQSQLVFDDIVQRRPLKTSRPRRVERHLLQVRFRRSGVSPIKRFSLSSPTEESNKLERWYFTSFFPARLIFAGKTRSLPNGSVVCLAQVGSGLTSVCPWQVFLG